MRTTGYSKVILLALVGIFMFAFASSTMAFWGKWDGSADKWWDNADNWTGTGEIVPGGTDLAVFNGDYYDSSSAAPEIDNGDTFGLGQLRSSDPQIAPNLTVNGKLVLTASHEDTGIEMSAATQSLTIDGSGILRQAQYNASGDYVEWDITGGSSSLAIQTAWVELVNNVDLDINTGTGNTVDLQASVTNTTSPVTKSGAGLLKLGGTNYWTGATTVGGGVVEFAENNAIHSDSALSFADGTKLETGGYDAILSTLDVAGTVIFDFEDEEETSALSFADSSGIGWGSTLAVTNFTWGGDSLRFGDGTGDGLTSAQLDSIMVNGEAGTGVYSLDGNGYLIPEPATFGMLAFYGIVYILRRKLMQGC